MPTGAEQAQVIRNLLIQGNYPEAYRYTASQISGNEDWNQKLVTWLNRAADINSPQRNFWKDWDYGDSALNSWITVTVH